MRPLLIAALFAAAGSVEAQDRPISPTEFGRIVEGRTLDWRYPDGSIGTEYYMENRQVLWSVTPGECTAGEWYALGQAVCFVYGDFDDPGCWLIYERDGKLVARDADTPLLELVEKGDAAPLVCGGPGA